MLCCDCINCFMNMEQHNGMVLIKTLATSTATGRADPQPVIESGHH